MRQINGLADCNKIQSGPEIGRYSVTVEDGVQWVELSIGGMTYPAGLTPDRARYIAQQLIDSAGRVESTKTKKEPAAEAAG